jgi:choline dehydrogenase-like flavoprotein
MNDPTKNGFQRGGTVSGHALGAGITAELLVKAGLQVIVIEEGPLKGGRDFNPLESEAYPSLYQDSAARKTRDKSIHILQGRCVGGSTTVIWTSSFRTPASTHQFWQDQFGLKEYSVKALVPYLEQVEQRLSITPWHMAPNENNDLLRRSAINSPAVLLRSGALDPHGRDPPRRRALATGEPLYSYGSLFPTSIGDNPQLSVYGVANLLAQGLVKRLAGRDVTLA